MAEGATGDGDTRPDLSDHPALRSKKYLPSMALTNEVLQVNEHDSAETEPASQQCGLHQKAVAHAESEPVATRLKQFQAQLRRSENGIEQLQKDLEKLQADSVLESRKVEFRTTWLRRRENLVLKRERAVRRKEMEVDDRKLGVFRRASFDKVVSMRKPHWSRSSSVSSSFALPSGRTSMPKLGDDNVEVMDSAATQTRRAPNNIATNKSSKLEAIGPSTPTKGGVSSNENKCELQPSTSLPVANSEIRDFASVGDAGSPSIRHGIVNTTAQTPEDPVTSVSRRQRSRNSLYSYISPSARRTPPPPYSSPKAAAALQQDKAETPSPTIWGWLKQTTLGAGRRLFKNDTQINGRTHQEQKRMEKLEREARTADVKLEQARDMERERAKARLRTMERA